MTRNAGRRSGWMALAILATTAACTEDGGSLSILQNQVPEDDCTIPGEPTESVNVVGLFDLATCLDAAGATPCSGYIFTPVIRNSAQEVTGDVVSRNEVQLTGADIELTYVNTQLSFDLITALGDDARRSQRFATRIEPGGTASVLFPVIDRSQADVIEGALPDGEESQVVARVQVFGVMNAGEVESSIYEYPVTLCKNCIPLTPAGTPDAPAELPCFEYQR